VRAIECVCESVFVRVSSWAEHEFALEAQAAVCVRECVCVCEVQCVCETSWAHELLRTYTHCVSVCEIECL